MKIDVTKKDCAKSSDTGKRDLSETIDLPVGNSPSNETKPPVFKITCPDDCAILDLGDGDKSCCLPRVQRIVATEQTKLQDIGIPTAANPGGQVVTGWKIERQPDLEITPEPPKQGAP